MRFPKAALLITAMVLSSQAMAKDYIRSWCAPEEPAPAVAPTATVSRVERIELSADALFRFNQSSVQDILPQGKAKLDELAGSLNNRGATVDSISVVGHTDRLGSEQYNYNLGLKRAETVRSYLQSQGVQSPINVGSAGESQPVTTDCVGMKPTAALKACLQPDRRVTVEITGSAPAP